jgi:hypothetical protein
MKGFFWVYQSLQDEGAAMVELAMLHLKESLKMEKIL